MGLRDTFRRFRSRESRIPAPELSVPLIEISSSRLKKFSLAGKFGIALVELVGLFHKDDRDVFHARFSLRKQTFKDTAVAGTFLRTAQWSSKAPIFALIQGMLTTEPDKSTPTDLWHTNALQVGTMSKRHRLFPQRHLPQTSHFLTFSLLL